MHSSEPANGMSYNPGVTSSDIPILEQVDSIRGRLEGVNYLLCKALEMINFECIEFKEEPMNTVERTFPVKGLRPEITRINDITCNIEAQSEMIIHAIGGNIK